MIGVRQAGLRSKRLRPNIAVRPSTSSVQVEDASGTDADTTEMAPGPASPETSAAFTVAPEVVYSPIVPLPRFVTNRFPPDTARPNGPFNPEEIKALLTVAPEVVYSPIVPLSKFVTNRFPPDTAIPTGRFNPEEIKALLTVAPEVVYSPIVLLKPFVTNRFPPDTARPTGPANPEIKALLTVAPEVVYLPIVLLSKFVTNRFPPDNAIPGGRFNPEEIKALLIVAPEVVYSPVVLACSFATNICPRLPAGMTQQSAADATKPERVNRIFIGFLSHPKGESHFSESPAATLHRNGWPIRIRRNVQQLAQ
jgi:hypothetical protein